MPKYRVLLNGYANATITVETDETDLEKILEEALTEGVPEICAQCGGWERDWSLEIGNEWEPETDKDGNTIVYREDD